MQIVKVDTNYYTQFVVDGFEQSIYSSSNEHVKNATFSGKKKKHTFTKLLFVTTNGWVVKLGDSYPGSKNDLNLADMPKKAPV